MSVPTKPLKSDEHLAFNANLKRLRTEGRIALDRLLNQAEHEMSEQFHAQLAFDGTILDLGADRGKLEKILLAAAQRTLGPGDVDDPA